MKHRSRIDMTGAIILIALMAMLGLNQVAVKIVNEGLAPIFQAGLRSLAAMPIIFIYCLWRGSKISISRIFLIPGIASGLAFAFEFTLLFQAIQWTTVARASVFFYTMPFWVALAAHFLIPGESLTKIRLLGFLLAGIGVIIALSNKNLAAGPHALPGDIMALAAATGWAAIAIIVKTTRLCELKPEVQLFYQLAVSAIVLLSLALFIDETFRSPDTGHWIIFAIQVIFVVCIGFVLWFWVLSVYPASDMASFSFLAPIFGVFFAWLVLDEKLTVTIVVALIFVACGIFLVNRKSKELKPS